MVEDFAGLILHYIKPPSSPAGRFTQILSVGIGGSALGPLKNIVEQGDRLGDNAGPRFIGGE
ncbi:hypothetical protein Scep_010886 [Stephania cephalantha]|uniref:Glucose-6-phosphate isomerase n=1 Tax=Stephania cephalantha TaxID=152367 RepID=A0AAP0PHG9_9MAGN